jgi:hypothetical protein
MNQLDKQLTDRIDKKDKYKCQFCGKVSNNPPSVICPCEVKPKYDPDYEEWKNK